MTMKTRTMMAMFAAVVMMALILGVAPNKAQAADPPVIKDWSSQGGNPRHKSDNRDLIYLVKPGDKITFSITTTEAHEHTWVAMRGAKVLLTRKKEGMKKSEFTFEVPREKGNWDIEVKVYGDVPRAGPLPSVHKTWTITTSSLKVVKSAESTKSIQKAIDSLPPKGGVVQLEAGVYIVDQPPIRIGRSHVTIRGEGMGKTILRKPRSAPPNKHILDVSRYDKPKVIKPKWQYWPNPSRDPEYFISDIVIEDICTQGPGAGAIEPGHSTTNTRGISLTHVANSRVSRVKCTDVPGTALLFHVCYDIAVMDNWVENTGLSIQFHWVRNCTVSGNTVINSTKWNGIDLNANCHEFKVCRNLVRGFAGRGGIVVYSSSTNNDVCENIVESGRVWGIVCINAWRNRIFRNTVKSCTIAGISVRSSNAKYANENTIVGNLIINTKGHGINFKCKQGTIKGTRILSNTIYGSRPDPKRPTYNGDGICLGPHQTEIRNNIIVNNSGIGIHGADVSASYNNVWKNAGGDYKGLAKGTCDISADPLFTNPSKGDFHLKSKVGHWDPKSKKWGKDAANSPCIDAGNPESEYKNEPKPNGDRINMGAYGNTKEASRSTAAKPQK